MITEQNYWDAEKQYICSTDEELAQMVRHAAEIQPALFAYIATYYNSLEEDQNRYFFTQLIYSTWIAYTRKYELRRKLSLRDVERVDRAEERRLNELHGDEEAILYEAIRKMTEHPQAALIGCIYAQIGDYFGEEQLRDENSETSTYRDAGVISGVMNSFITLLERSRQILHIP